jgi:hypothetical protein
VKISTRSALNRFGQAFFTDEVLNISLGCVVGSLLARADVGRNLMSESTSRFITPNPLGSLFEPDILTAHQFLRVFRAKGHLGPEERLMFAVLSDAIDCFQKHFGAKSRRCQRLFNEAEAWIRSQDARWPYSFEQICDVLSINPNYLRIGLTRWRGTHEVHKPRRKRLREPLRYQYRARQTRACI